MYVNQVFEVHCTEQVMCRVCNATNLTSLMKRGIYRKTKHEVLE